MQRVGKVTIQPVSSRTLANRMKEGWLSTSGKEKEWKINKCG